MLIISHRGFWKTPEERNTIKAFNNSIRIGSGIETDIRDSNGELVISHDPACGNDLKLNSILDSFKTENLLLALNVKADGLQNLLTKSLTQYNITNYFVFDMSIPETRGYINMGFNVFCRQSEYEEHVSFYSEAKGIWLDAFERIWYDTDVINGHLKNGKQLCIVSAEIHKRDNLKHWQFLKSCNIVQNNNVILCTDYPEDARRFFENNT